MIRDTYLRHVDPTQGRSISLSFWSHRSVNYEWSSEFLYLSNIVWFLFCLLIQYIKMLFTIVWHIKVVKFPLILKKKEGYYLGCEGMTFQTAGCIWMHSYSLFIWTTWVLRVVHHYSIFYIDLICISPKS